MNRVILIGNGFDLAHGIDTSYTSFIKSYLTSCLKSAIVEEYSDSLIHVITNGQYRGDTYAHKDDISQWVNDCYDAGFNLSKLGPAVQNWDGRTFGYPYKVSSRSPIFAKLIEHCSLKRWVDIEAIFYEALTEVISKRQKDKDECLKVINDSMRELIKHLKSYLSALPSASRIEAYNTIFFDYVYSTDLESQKKGDGMFVLTNKEGHPSTHSRPEETLILNFNYTNTVELYAVNKSHSFPDVALNYIHGDLRGNDELVFGFGDEFDKRYSTIEDENINAYFEHIKSFSYLKTSNYKDLVRFVDGKEYQVVILGHSCGLSDRTMLNMLFEHGNCKSIKLYYHGVVGKNNYTQVTYEMARHFHDKPTMRKRIMSLDKSSRMDIPLILTT